MHIVICDDEPRYLAQLKELVVSYSIKHNLDLTVKTCNSLEDLNSLAPTADLIFLDICFPDGGSGIQWAMEQRARGLQCMIVLCSLMQSQMQAGYKAEAIRFLVKPVEQAHVYEAMDAAYQKLFQPTKSLVITSSFFQTVIPVNKILYIYSENRVRTIVLDDEEPVPTYETLVNLAERLDSRQFFLAHKCYLVHLSKVKQLVGNTIHMINGATAPLARGLAADFRKALLYYVEEKT